MHEPQGFESRIAYAEGEPGAIAIDNLEIVSAANADRLKETKAVIARRRARAHPGRSGDRQDAAVPGAGGIVAVGRRTDHAPARGADLLSAARHALSAARHAARGARLSAEGGELRRQWPTPELSTGSASSDWR